MAVWVSDQARRLRCRRLTTEEIVMENALGEPQTIVLLGGTSDIGRAIVDASGQPGDPHRRARRP